jgi:mRNA-degrading endonuclease RelE of RelBE toxin-antitoxin system
MYKVLIKNKVLKSIEKMPKSVQEKMNLLIKDLKDKGPFRSEWTNYSKLGDDLYHCHLSYKWIACWKYEKNTIVIEVYYAGSRENAPY